MAAPARLTDAEIAARLQALPGWNLERGKLHKPFAFRDFVEAWGFMSAVAEQPERDGLAKRSGAAGHDRDARAHPVTPKPVRP